MTKSELVKRLASRMPVFSSLDVEKAVKVLLDQMTLALSHQRRIEIRGFGSFELRARKARTGRNPRTGDSIQLPSRYAPHFKAGKEMRDRINHAVNAERER